MIARLWHGVTVASKPDAYLDYLNTTGVPDYRATEGNRGVYVLRRMEGDHAHFLLLSLWDSSEAIQQFAGADMERARDRVQVWVVAGRRGHAAFAAY